MDGFVESKYIPKYARKVVGWWQVFCIIEMRLDIWADFQINL